MDRLIEVQGDAILQIARAHGGARVRLFGSMARGDASPASDVDVIVDLPPDRSLLDLSDG